jgi:hypothetical protein
MSTLAEQVGALKLPELSPEELAHYLGLSMAQYEKYRETVTPDDLAFIQQARAVEHLAPLWESGVEPYPSDVSVNRARKQKHRSKP